MKKRIVVGATLVALMLSVSLFAISVFAAISQTFGVNNRIIFVGSDLIEFVLTAEITGTNKDGDESLSASWDFSTDDDDNETTKMWNVTESLVFDEENKVLDPTAANKISITYTFNIALSEDSDRNIRVYIAPETYDTASLILNTEYTIGSPAIITRGTSKTITVELIPTVRFDDPKPCNFNVILEPMA